MKVAPSYRSTLTLASILMLPHLVVAQTIQRCEDANKRITYSNAECPAGTKPVKSVAPPPQPSAEDQAAAQAKLQRARDDARDQKVAPKAERTPPAPAAASDSAVRKAADCGYLRASIDSARQMRNVLTTRPYYSTEDVDAADARIDELVADYRRVCG